MVEENLLDTLCDSAFPLFLGVNKNKFYLQKNQEFYNPNIIYYCLDTKCIIYDIDSINDVLQSVPFLNHFYKNFKEKYTKICTNIIDVNDLNRHNEGENNKKLKS